MKKIGIFLFCLVLMLAISSEVYASQTITFTDIPEGIEISIDKPPAPEPNSNLSLFIEPVKEEEWLRPGEFSEIGITLFSPEGPNKVILTVLEEENGKLKETKKVLVETSEIEIYENKAMAELVVFLPEEIKKKKFHFVVLFSAEGNILAKSDIYIHVIRNVQFFTRLDLNRELEDEENTWTLSLGAQKENLGGEISYSYHQRPAKSYSEVCFSLHYDW